MSNFKEKVRRYLKNAGAGSMLISIIVHVIILGLATAWVVNSVQTQRKANFQGGGNPNPAPAVQHPVKMSNTQPNLDTLNTKRLVVESSSSSVTLPDLPSIGGSGPGSLSGAGSLGPGAAGAGSGAGTPNLRAPIMPAFGFKEAQPGGTLVGNFYDFKQLRGPKPNPDFTGNLNAAFDPAASSLAYREVINFVDSNWSRTKLYKFFMAPNPLYATQIYIPSMSASEAPKAYGVDKVAKDKSWIALYRGRVSPPEHGTYRFVGGGDDILIVRMDGRLVLDGSIGLRTKFKSDKDTGYKYNFRGNLFNGGFRVGLPMQLRAGQFYDIQIIVGEAPGGGFNSFLLIEKEGATYEKNSSGAPILPIFRVADSKTEPTDSGPPFVKDGPIWRAVPPPN